MYVCVCIINENVRVDYNTVYWKERNEMLNVHVEFRHFISFLHFTQRHKLHSYRCLEC